MIMIYNNNSNNNNFTNTNNDNNNNNNIIRWCKCGVAEAGGDSTEVEMHLQDLLGIVARKAMAQAT